MNNGKVKIPRRILGTLLNAEGAGVVPRYGLEYIAIGRQSEIKAIAGDLDFIMEGGASFRLIIGRYGSGKSFLLQLVRGHCLERGFITADADLTPERRLSGTKGQGVSVYRELMTNLASRSSPDGNALVQIISRWLAGLQTEIIAEKGFMQGSSELEREMEARILGISQSLENLVCGFDFASVLNKYYKSYMRGDETGKSNAIRWLRGEYTTKTEARADLGTGVIIDDQNWYDFIKLMALFVRKIGYKGLVVFIDECVILYKIPHKISRENNYEKILSMFNDTMQGKAEGLGIYMGGTPQFLEDTRRGLYSYEALKSRMADNKLFGGRYVNLMGPVIRLERLTDEEIFALSMRIYMLHAEYHGYERTLSEGDILEYLKAYMGKVGADTLITPREIIRDLLNILDILFQNPGTQFTQILKREEKHFTAPADADNQTRQLSHDAESVMQGIIDTDKGNPADSMMDLNNAQTAFKLEFDDLEI